MEKACDGGRRKVKRTEVGGGYRKKAEIEDQSTDIESEMGETDLKIKGHYYDVKTIQQAIHLLINSGISFRGVEKVFELFNDCESQSSPSFSGIRKWLGRIAIYELKREKEYRRDWIYIVDFTLALGKHKALVVLGVSQEYLLSNVIEEKRGLSHKDVEILALEIMESTKGEIIEKQLDKISQKVGVPRQIVADNSSDLARGIKLYQENHPEVIYTHDVTHAMALLLKYQLESDKRYQSFIQKCSICRQQLQQTELCFLAPPSQRSQCRYFNIERLTDWGTKLLNSSVETLISLIPDIAPTLIYQKVRDKLGWLNDYQSDLIKWNQMILLTRSIETELKQSGINHDSLEHFANNQENYDDDCLQKLQQDILGYLAVQCNKIKHEGTFLATSDVIESLFGKYKQFSTRCPFKQISQMLLTICLSTMDLTTTVVKNALLNISFSDVEEWVFQVFGQSSLSKRKILFSPDSEDTETA